MIISERQDRRLVFSKLTAALLGTVVFFPIASAQAQSAPQSGADNPPVSSQAESGIGEIIVTAERRSVDVQRTPISIVAVTGDQLTRKGVDNVAQLQQLAPNLVIGGSVPNGNVEPQFSIRGIGQASGHVQSEKGVALYIDDVYYPQSIGALFRLLDVERVEVLRGPQGTLFGRNAEGGAVRIITNKPAPNLYGEVSATTGSRNRIDITGLINIPFSDKLFGRFQAGSWNQDGYGRFVPNGFGNNSGQVGTRPGNGHDQAYRGQLRYKPDDNLTVDLSVTHTNTDNNPGLLTVSGLNAYNFTPNIPPFGSKAMPRIQAYNAYLTSIGQPIITAPPFARESNDPRFLSPGPYSAPDNCILNKVPRTLVGQPGGSSNADNNPDFCHQFTRAKATFINLDVRAKLNDNIELRSVSAWQKVNEDFNVDQSGLGVTSDRSVSRLPSYSEELQFLGDYGRWRWVAGGSYFVQDPFNVSYNHVLLAVNGRAICCGGFDRYVDIHSKSWGVFAESNYDITDRLTLTVGLRYSRDMKDFKLARTQAGTSGAITTINLKTSGAWSSTDYRVTANYRVAEGINLFATRSTGYKPGGISGDVILSSNPVLYPKTNGTGLLPYVPEKNINNEIGFKSQWFRNRLRFNLTGYRMTYTDLIINAPDFSDPTGNVTVNEVNSGKVRLSGLEGEIVVQPISSVQFSASAGTIDIKYLSLPNNSPLFMNYPGQDRQITCPAGVGPGQPLPATLAAGCKAIRLPNTPALSYTLGASFNHKLAGGTVHATASYSHLSSQTTSATAINALPLPPYGLLNLQLSYQAPGWSLTLSGTNVLDKLYYTGGSMGRLTPFQTVFANPGVPAQWSIQFKKSFGR